MSVLTSLKLVEFKPFAPSAAYNRRKKLLDKIDQQICLANDPAYTATKLQRVTGEDGIERNIEVPKRIKSWWHQALDGKVVLTIRYGSKPLELAKGLRAIVLNSPADVPVVLGQIKQAVADGEFDALLEAQVGFGKKLTTKKAAKLSEV